MMLSITDTIEFIDAVNTLKEIILSDDNYIPTACDSCGHIITKSTKDRLLEGMRYRDYDLEDAEEYYYDDMDLLNDLLVSLKSWVEDERNEKQMIPVKNCIPSWDDI